MTVFISNGKKLRVSAYSGHLQVLTTFLLNSVKNTTINIWLNDGVYLQWKNYMFRPVVAIFRFRQFSALFFHRIHLTI